MSIRSEAADIAHFHGDGHSPNPANSRKSEQLGVKRNLARATQDCLLDLLDALSERLHLFGLLLRDELMRRVSVKLGRFRRLQLLGLSQIQAASCGAPIQALKT